MNCFHDSHYIDEIFDFQKKNAEIFGECENARIFDVLISERIERNSIDSLFGKNIDVGKERKIFAIPSKPKIFDDAIENTFLMSNISESSNVKKKQIKTKKAKKRKRKKQKNLKSARKNSTNNWEFSWMKKISLEEHLWQK